MPKATPRRGGLGLSHFNLAYDAGLVRMTHDRRGNVLDVGRRRRTVPPALRRALEHRNGRCRCPGCGSRFCDVHHVRPWA